MAEENFEGAVKKKLSGAKAPVPPAVWAGVTNSLNRQMVNTYSTSQNRYKWAAVAAIFIAILSVAFSYLASFDSDTADTPSYNALLSGQPAPFAPVPQFKGNIPWPGIIFMTTDRSNREATYGPTTASEGDEGRPFLETKEIDHLSPGLKLASGMERPEYLYLTPLVGQGKIKRKASSSFWAGVEAGAGVFTPEASGSTPINGDVNFDAVANTLGQNGFANPSSFTYQDGMQSGISMSLGLDFGVKMNRWTLESGIHYTSLDNTSVASVDLVDVYTISAREVLGNSNETLGAPIPTADVQSTEVEENFEHFVEMDNSIRFTSIPLKAGYFLSENRVSLRLNAGITANYFISDRFVDPTGQLVNPSHSFSYNSWSFDGITGVEFGYAVFDNFNLTFEPNYRHSIIPISNSLNTRSGFMLQTGFRYMIR